MVVIPTVMGLPMTVLVVVGLPMTVPMTVLMVVPVVIMGLPMAVIMVMLVIVPVVVMTPLMMVMATVGTVHVHLLDARGASSLATGDGFSHQPVFFRLGRRGMIVIPMVMVMGMPKTMVVVVIMVMIVIMMMIVIVALGMTMPVVMILTMLVAMVMVVVAAHRTQAIGAAFRLERGIDEAHVGAKLLDQLDQHIVVADAQGAVEELGRRMAIAQVPGDARDHMRIGRAEFHQPLRLGRDQHDRAGFQCEAVALHQRRRFGEIDVKGLPLGTSERGAPPPPILEIEFHGIDRRGGIEAAGVQDLGRTDHRLARGLAPGRGFVVGAR